MTPRTPLSVHEPDAPARGGIVVVQEVFGVNAHIEDVARRLADDGWLAVAPHLFHRSGDPAFGYESLDEPLEHMGKLDAPGILADVDAALEHLGGAGFDARRCGIVGFCMGGTVAMAVATRRDIGAAVTFYGSGIRQGRFGFDPLVDEAPRLRGAWLGHYGDLDHGIPVEEVEALREAAARSNQSTEVVRYADAGHGFICDARASYAPEAARDAWARTLAWFGRHLEGGPAAAEAG